VSLGSVGPADIRSDKYITECVTASVEIHCTKPPGDILVFLTGQAEIASAARRLFKLSEELDYRIDVAGRGVDGLLILPMCVVPRRPSR
jgi:HrpA-like RNA helicase